MLLGKNPHRILLPCISGSSPGGVYKSAEFFPSLCSWSAVEAHRCQRFANRHLSRLVSEKWSRCRWVYEVQSKERASAFHHPMHKIAKPLPLSLHFPREWKLSLVAEWALAQCYHTNQEISYSTRVKAVTRRRMGVSSVLPHKSRNIIFHKSESCH